MNKQARKLQAELRVLTLIAEDMTKQTGICLMSYDEQTLKEMIEEKEHQLTMMLNDYTERLHKRLDKVTTLLEREKCMSRKLDKGWNTAIDAHEATKERLALYENEVGVPHNKGIADHRLNG